LASSGVTLASALAPRAPGKPPGGGTVGTRETVANMGEDHPTLVAYRTAIGKMKGLPDTDPLSWTYQANMHGVPNNPGMVADWNWCIHGSWWFLPWHRGYLYFFERIVRKMSRDDTFSLPYWPWEQSGQNVLPAPFRAPTYRGATNHLFDGTRTVANRGGPLRPDSQSSSGSFAIDWENARTTGQFTTPYPELSYGGLKRPKTTLPQKPQSTDHGVMESQAHDLIHDAIAGNMGDPKTAANDPIFWLHHANVDRLWNQWLNGRGHENPTDPDWYDQQFAFYDESGTRVVQSVADILTRAAAAYRYDDERRLIAARVNRGVQAEAPVEQTIVGVASAQPMLKLGATPFTKGLAFDENEKPRLAAALSAPPAVNAEPAAVLLRVEGIRPPADPKVTFDVFLTKAGEKATRKAYVGALSFFGRTPGGDGHGAGEGFTQGFDVTRVVQALRRANRGTLPDLQVSIVPHSTAGLTDGDLAKEKIEVPIGNVTLKLVTTEKK
jgi:tyrosinase